jgi:hypothetical protein
MSTLKEKCKQYIAAKQEYEAAEVELMEKMQELRDEGQKGEVIGNHYIRYNEPKRRVKLCCSLEELPDKYAKTKRVQNTEALKKDILENKTNLAVFEYSKPGFSITAIKK